MLKVLYAQCIYAECHYAECHYAECHYAECHYAECHYAECHYAECRGAEESVTQKPAKMTQGKKRAKMFCQFDILTKTFSLCFSIPIPVGGIRTLNSKFMNRWVYHCATGAQPNLDCVGK